MYVLLNHFAVHLKLTQCCNSTVLENFFNLFFKISMFDQGAAHIF